MHVALNELVRSTPDILRGYGLSFSAADRAGPMLVWCEAAYCLSLAYLRAAQGIIGAPLPSPRLQEGPYGSLTIDFGRQSLVTCGPGLLDIAIARAQRDGRSTVRARGASGHFLLGEMVVRAAHQGFLALAAFGKDAAGCDARFDGSGILVAAEDSEGPLFASYAGQVDAGAFLPAQDGSVVDLLRRSIPADPLQGIETVEDCGIVLHLVDISQASMPGLRDAVGPGRAHAGWQGVQDPGARMGRAVSNGLDVDAGDYHHLAAIATSVRLPTSERSRAQAG